ncbi:MAG: cysteine desulfurase [Rickettsiaceae bacterium]|nr:cysteine desulfurase [Rickettsiaceae bacterium]
MIYLDHNATTNILPEVLQDLHVLYNKTLNASSVHLLGRESKALLEQARTSVLNLLGGNGVEYGVVFTSSGTEANNLILNNFLDDEIFISAIEHPSIYNFAKFYKNVIVISVNPDGIIDLEELEKRLAKSNAKRKLISVMLANNETGIVQPLSDIASLAQKYGAYLHSDAVQAIGKMGVNISQLGVDFLSLSAHKFGGMIGAGALVYKIGFPLRPQLIGGGQEKSLRSGTENIIAIVAMAKAADLVVNNLSMRSRFLGNLRDEMEANLHIECPEVEIVGKNMLRLPNTSLLINRKQKSEIQIIGLDIKSIFVSAGSACSSGKISNSHVLSAMGYSNRDAGSAIRISFGMNNNINEVKEFLTIYKQLNI